MFLRLFIETIAFLEIYFLCCVENIPHFLYVTFEQTSVFISLSITCKRVTIAIKIFLETSFIDLAADRTWFRARNKEFIIIETHKTQLFVGKNRYTMSVIKNEIRGGRKNQNN